MVLWIVAAIGLLILTGILFISFSPQFGKPPSSELQKSYQDFDNFEDGKFTNQSETKMEISYVKMLKDWMKKAPHRAPQKTIQVEKIDSLTIEKRADSITQLTWFGHSTFLLEIDGKNILLDPMMGDSPSPIPALGASRYSDELPIQIEQLPFVDAVILSHDHYDHLDYGSIQKLKNKVGRFFTPTGVGSHLIAWGVAKEKITELNWWQTAALDSIQLVCTPARHFSGRGLFDRSATLWASWVITGTKENIFFSGDSGYDNHFKTIGEKYGPFDLSMLECGQYNLQWKSIHMLPEETAQAGIDLKSKLTMPIHWGAFTLAMHDWMEPVQRMKLKAAELNLPVTTPKIGEALVLGKETFPIQKWWEEYINE